MTEEAINLTLTLDGKEISLTGAGIISEGQILIGAENAARIYEGTGVLTDVTPDEEPEEPEEPTIPLPPPNTLGGPNNPPDFPVTVPMGQTVTIPAGEHELPVQVVEGTLIIEDGAHIKTPGFCIMGHNGLLQIGSEDNPCADVRIELTGQHDTVNDPFAWFPGLNCGANIKMFGTPVGLDGPLYPFPDFEQKYFGEDYRRYPRTTTDPNAWEVITDWGEVIKAGDCNLTRGITVVGGHTALLHHAKYQLDNVCFQDAQGTRNEFAENSKIYEDGSIHIGTNNIGRYGFHLHHTMHNPENFARNLVVNGARKWGFVLHMSEGAVLENPLAWNVEGSAFVREGILKNGMKIINGKALGVTGDLSTAATGGDAVGGAKHRRMKNGDMIQDGGRAGNGFWADNAMGIDLERFVALGINFIAVNDNGKDWRGPADETPGKREFYTKGCYSPHFAVVDRTYSPRPYKPREVTMYADNCTIGLKAVNGPLITYKGRVDSDPAVAKKNKRETIGVDLNHGINGGCKVFLDVRGFNHGIDLPQRNDTLREGNDTWHIEPTIVEGEYSNDVDVWATDSVRFEETLTHQVNITRTDSSRPGKESPKALQMEGKTKFAKPTRVNFNGEEYELTEDSGPIEVV